MSCDSNDSGATRDDELFDSLLVAYDDALASGAVPPSVDPKQVPTGMAPDLQCAEALLELIERARRTPHASGDHSSDVSEALGASNGNGHDVGAGHLQPDGQIDRFLIIRELGRGGYGVVFLALDPDLQRYVALKVPRPEVTVSAELLQRFLREAQAAGSLAHPNLVSVYETGEDGPIRYIASAYCSGPTLAQWLQGREEPVPVRRAANLVANLADGVEHAHRLGILHRDIKPGNVLLEPQSADAPNHDVPSHEARFTPKLTDFGLARFADGDGTTTRTGALLGTASYMAPELATGRLHQVGPSTDVYGLGTILYELITAQRAFQGASDVDTLWRIVKDEPIRPRRLRHDVPRDLEAICLKCLEKRPQDRYPSADALARDLRRFLACEPTAARPAGPARRTWKWARRQPAIAGFLLVTMVLLTAMAAGGWWYSAQLAGQQTALLQRQYLHDVRAGFEAREHGAFDRAAALLGRYDEGTRGAGLRNFEWYYLRDALDEEQLVIPARHGEAYTVVFTADGSLLLSGGEDGVIRAWDPQTGSLQFELRGHTSCVNQLVLSPDGRTVASASCDHTVRLWDVAERRELGTLGDHPQQVMCLAYAHHHPWVATGSHDNLVRVWDTQTGRPVVELPAPSAGPIIDSVAFRSDDQVLAATLGSQNSFVWQTDSWTEIQRFPFRALSLAFVGQEQQLVCGTVVGDVLNWSFSNAAPTRLLGAMPSDVDCLAALHRGDVFFVGSNDGSVHAFNLRDKLSGAKSGGADRVQSLAVSPDDRRLAAASFDGTVRVWDLEPRSLFRPQGFNPDRVTISRNAARAIAHTSDGSVRMWDVDSGAIEGEGSGVGDCRFSPRGRYVVAVTDVARKLRLLHAPSLKPAAPFLNELQPITVSISADDRVIAMLERSGRISIFEIASGKKCLEYELPQSERVDVIQPALSADGSLLTWISEGVMSSFAVDVDSGRHVPLPDDLSFLAVTSIIPGGDGFSPDGRLVVTGREGHTQFVRDVFTGKVVHALQHSRGLMPRYAWSPDGTRLAIATRDHTVVIYDPHTGDSLGELDACLEPIISNLIFSPDWRTLMAFTGGGRDNPGRWHVWRADRD